MVKFLALFLLLFSVQLLATPVITGNQLQQITSNHLHFASKIAAARPRAVKLEDSVKTTGSLVVQTAIAASIHKIGLQAAQQPQKEEVISVTQILQLSGNFAMALGFSYFIALIIAHKLGKYFSKDDSYVYLDYKSKRTYVDRL